MQILAILLRLLGLLNKPGQKQLQLLEIVFVYVLSLPEILLDFEYVFSVLLDLLEQASIVEQGMAITLDFVVSFLQHVSNEKLPIAHLADIAFVPSRRQRKLPDLVHTLVAVGDGTEVAVLQVLLGLVVGLAAVALARLLGVHGIVDVAQGKDWVFEGEIMLVLELATLNGKPIVLVHEVLQDLGALVS